MKTIDLTGQVFGRLTVVGIAPKRHGKTRWFCRCSCDGKIVVVLGDQLRRGLTRSCGCLQREATHNANFRDYTGRKFGRLLVVARAPNRNGKTMYFCKCDCGNPNLIVVAANNLISGNTTSCGCFATEEKSRVHGKYHDPNVKYLAIDALSSIKARCYNPNNIGFAHYGGRGIKICDEWLQDPQKFADWALANGWRPGLTIDRIDVNGGYTPENCRWVTMKVQQNNRTNNRLLTVDGETKTLAEWRDLVGISRYKVYRCDTDKEVVDLIKRVRRERSHSETSAHEFRDADRCLHPSLVLNNQGEKEMDKESPASVTFMGKECQVTIKSDHSEKITMRKTDYADLLAELGVTKEVRDAVTAADNKIIAEAAKFQSERLLKANKGKKEGDASYVAKSELVLGAGDCQMITEYTPHKHHTSVDMKTHEKRETDKFGIFRVQKVCQIAQEIKKEGGFLDQQAKQFEADWRKVNK